MTLTLRRAQPHEIVHHDQDWSALASDTEQRKLMEQRAAEAPRGGESEKAARARVANENREREQQEKTAARDLARQELANAQDALANLPSGVDLSSVVSCVESADLLAKRIAAERVVAIAEERLAQHEPNLSRARGPR